LVAMALPEKLQDYRKSNDIEEREKIYKEAVEKLKEGKTPPYILIIDEINRANIPAVLGELIYALEYRNKPVKTLYGDNLIIPSNLYIIGTMNTADKSAGRIDYAIRRRFLFYKMLPEPNYVKEDGKNLMEKVNEFIEKNVAPDYDPEDIKLGHTYFISTKNTDTERKRDIAYKFIYQVVPLLYEYIQDGIVKAQKEEGKGYKLQLSIDLETGKEESKDYYLRGGRLYKDNKKDNKDDKEIKMDDLWFIPKQQ